MNSGAVSAASVCNSTVPLLKTQAHAYEQYCIRGKLGKPQDVFQPNHPHFSSNFPLSAATWRTHPKHEEMQQELRCQQCMVQMNAECSPLHSVL